MLSIAEIKFDFQPTVEAKSSRNELLAQLYQLYVSQPELTRKENRSRYHEYVRVHHPEVCKKSGFDKRRYDTFKEEFKKAKLTIDKKFLGYVKENSFGWWGKFSHLKGEDGNRALEHMISVAKDKVWRKENVAMYIMGSVKYVEKSVDNKI